MRLKTLRLKNFRGFEDATLDLDRPVTVLLGANGSGKSSVLMALVLGFSDVLDPLFARAKQGHGFTPNDDDIRLGATEAAVEIELSNDDGVMIPVALTFSRGQRHRSTRRPSDRLFQSPDRVLLPICYGADRTVTQTHAVFEPIDLQKEPFDAAFWVLSDTLDTGHLGFRSFFRWFKEREDAENRRKVQENDLSASDPQLSAVRRAVEGLLPGFSNLRIQHDPLRLEVSKGGVALSVNQLSDGEKLVLAVTADIARRLAMTYPKHADPLQQEAIVLVDEVELHLHPQWQRRVLPAWMCTFPGCQFVVTTHSPQVISEVPGDAVFLVKDFQFFRPGAPTAGRDSNAILEEVMATPERPEPIKEKLAAVSRLIDLENYPQAEAALDLVAAEVTENDSEVVRLRTLLHFMGAGDAMGEADAADPEKP